jgi:hypothetical protein
MKKKMETAITDKQSAVQQYNDIFTVFATLRKALVVSVQKTKKLETENYSLECSSRKFEEAKWTLSTRVDALENELDTLKKGIRKDRE